VSYVWSYVYLVREGFYVFSNFFLIKRKAQHSKGENGLYAYKPDGYLLLHSFSLQLFQYCCT
jgi:hypothetical protein